MNFTKPMFVHVRSKNIRKLLLNTAMANFCRRQDDVLSFEELVLHSVVLELLELLEGLECPRAHGSIIRPRRAKNSRAAPAGAVAPSDAAPAHCRLPRWRTPDPGT